MCQNRIKKIGDKYHIQYKWFFIWRQSYVDLLGVPVLVNKNMYGVIWYVKARYGNVRLAEQIMNSESTKS